MLTGSNADSWSVFLPQLKKVRAAWPARGWSWDGRLSSATSSFDIELAATARAAAAMALAVEWTSTTIADAPSAIRSLAGRTGGLRAGQVVFAGEVVGTAFVYGLWWPWNNQRTISMRIGFEGIDAMEDALESLRQVFSIEM